MAQPARPARASRLEPAVGARPARLFPARPGFANTFPRARSAGRRRARRLGRRAASKNLAYILQQVADADTILPVWQSGIERAERLANVRSGRGDDRHVPQELHDAHALIADELEGVIDFVMTLERELHVEMFHGDEVYEEATLFAKIGGRSGPRYHELKNHDGVRLLIRLLYHGMQE